MKKAAKILSYVLLQIFILTACAAKNENDTPSTEKAPSATEEPSGPIQADAGDAVVKQEEENSNTKELMKETKGKQETTAQEEASQPEKIMADAENQQETVDKKQGAPYNPYPEKEWNVTNELSQEEIDFFTDFMNRTENNGFLQSEYKTATDVNLNEVFYNGAGVSAHSLSAEEEAAYEEKVSWGIETDVERLTTEEIDRFLQRKTGYSYAEMNMPLQWTYLEQFDVYVSDHGDTNWRAFCCTGGRVRGDIYEVYYDDVDNDGILTLKRNGDDYLIVSNQWDYVPDLSKLSADEIKQLTVFAENKELWNKIDPSHAKLSYAVFDLNHDGSLELITGTPAETAEPSEYRFYQTDDAFTTLEEPDQESLDALYAELETEKDEIVWKKTAPTELNEASAKKVFRLLTESYRGYWGRYY